jgi:hypothetical protein
MARSLGQLLERGLRGQWAMKRLFPSKSELEALALHLLATTQGQTDSVAAEVGAMPLNAFAGAARADADLSLDEGLAVAVDEYWELCKDSGYIPRGARLSASPVLACVSCRVARSVLDLNEIETLSFWDLLHPSLRRFRSHLSAPIDVELAVVLNECARLAKGADPSGPADPSRDEFPERG